MALDSSTHTSPEASMVSGPIFSSAASSTPNSEDAHRLVVADQLTAMLRQELSYTVDLSPQQSGPPTFTSLPRDEWRRKICEWSYKVVDHFKYDREVVSVSMNYFDRFLVLSDKSETKAAADDHGRLEKQRKRQLFSTRNRSRQARSDYGCRSCSCREGVEEHMTENTIEAAGTAQSPTSSASASASASLASSSSSSSIDSRTYQLAAMTALYLAIKLHAETGVDDMNPFDGMDDCYYRQNDYDVDVRRHKKKLKLLSFVELSRGQFSPDDITCMESTMLSVLKWKVNPPTPMSLVTYLLRLFPSSLSIAPSRCPLMSCLTNPDSDPQPHQNYELVLHVLHELSRYLTELSICLTEVSTVYPPSAIAYASILISLDMITAEALPVRIRHDFFSAVACASSLALGCDMNIFFSGLLLVPHDASITYLKRRIRNSFLPEMLLDNCGGSDEHFPGHQQHPITIARNAGLLDMNVLYEQDDVTSYASPDRRKNTIRSTSVLGPSTGGDNDVVNGTNEGGLQTGSPVCVSRHELASRTISKSSHCGNKRRNNGMSSVFY